MLNIPFRRRRIGLLRTGLSVFPFAGVGTLRIKELSAARWRFLPNLVPSARLHQREPRWKLWPRAYRFFAGRIWRRHSKCSAVGSGVGLVGLSALETSIRRYAFPPLLTVVGVGWHFFAQAIVATGLIKFLPGLLLVRWLFRPFRRFLWAPLCRRSLLTVDCGSTSLFPPVTGASRL